MTGAPYADALGVRLQPEGETAVAVMSPSERVEGRSGLVHGGAIAGLLEIAALAALQRMFGPEDHPRMKPVTVTVDFRRSGRLIETRASGTVTRLGRRIANVDAVAWQDDRDRPIATARMNVLLDRDDPVR